MSSTGTSLPDIDALDSKTASGFRKRIAGNFKKASCYRREKSTHGRRIHHQDSDCPEDVQELQSQ